MLSIEYDPKFLNTVAKIRDNMFKEKVKKQIKKIIEHPEIGKPMRYGRKRTRELYVKPYRIAYAYSIRENKIIFLDIYHKDEQ